MRTERLERVGTLAAAAGHHGPGDLALGPHLRLERNPALHPAASGRGAGDASQRRRAAVRLAAGDAEDHLSQPRSGGGRRRRAGGAVHAVEMGGDVVLPVRGRPAGDADRGDLPADQHLCRQPDGQAPALRLDRRLLPDPVQHDARAEFGRPQSAATSSGSTARRAGRSFGICACRRRCRISSAD